VESYVGMRCFWCCFVVVGVLEVCSEVAVVVSAHLIAEAEATERKAGSSAVKPFILLNLDCSHSRSRCF
jgi:hypothetical protein